ncbi:MAG: hypothetical protein ABJ239_07800 [Erythrobacter sp.]
MMDQNEITETGLPQFSKGKRPTFFEVEGMDEAMSMIMTLASELSVMRDRMETMELLLAENGALETDAIDAFKPVGDVLGQRDKRRQDLLTRMHYLTLKRAHEQAGGETERGYFDTLGEIAGS